LGIFKSFSRSFSCFSPLKTQYGHVLQIPRQANQPPFATHPAQSTQEKLANPHHHSPLTTTTPLDYITLNRTSSTLVI
jgi:hypothetical protein